MQAARGDFLLSSDPEPLDFDVIPGVLVQSDWCAGIPRALVEQAAKDSHPRGVYRCPCANERQEVRSWMLVTRDAHALNRKCGFGGLESPGRLMRRAVPPSWQA